MVRDIVQLSDLRPHPYTGCGRRVYLPLPAGQGQRRSTDLRGRQRQISQDAKPLFRLRDYSKHAEPGELSDEFQPSPV